MSRDRLIRACSVSLLALTIAAGVSGASLPDTKDLRVVEAAERGDSAGVRTLLQQKADVNAAQGDGMTALHWAAMNDDIGIARVLIQAGASVKATTRVSAETPLLLACKNGDAPLVEELLKAGAEAGAANKKGTTALMLAAASGDARTVKALLDHGADINVKELTHGQTALMFAASLDRAEVIRLLASRGANMNLASNPEKLGKALQYGRVEADPDEAKQQSAKLGSAPAAGTIVEESADGKAPGGAKIVVADEDRISGAGYTGGMSALLFATRDGHIGTVQTLVESGSNINQVSADKTTPIVMAIQNGHYDVAKYLLDHGADPNIQNESGLAALYATIDAQYAPLGWAPNPITAQEKISHRDLMKALLDKGADPNARLTRKLWFRALTHSVGWVDAAGATPLWRAAQSVDVPAMRLLVEHGANPGIATNSGETPLMVAAGIGWATNFTLSAPEADSWMTAVKFLVEHGSDVNAKDFRGYTALGGAAFRGNPEMVLYLVSRGAQVDAIARDGNTIADMANGIFEHSAPSPETVALLEKLGSANSHNCRSSYCLIVPKTPGAK